MYEDSISESRAQLQAITLIIGTLAGAKVFGVDNYDTLITKAALHGAKLLKKSHQATAVGLASHLWWQEAQPPVDADGEVNAAEKEAKEVAPAKEENGEGSAKAVCVDAFDCLSVPSSIAVWFASTLIRTASVSWSASKNHFVLPTRQSKRL